MDKWHRDVGAFVAGCAVTAIAFIEFGLVVGVFVGTLVAVAGVARTRS